MIFIASIIYFQFFCIHFLFFQLAVFVHTAPVRDLLSADLWCSNTYPLSLLLFSDGALLKLAGKKILLW